MGKAHIKISYYYYYYYYVLNGLLCQCTVSVIHDLLLHNCHVELSGMAFNQVHF